MYRISIDTSEYESKKRKGFDRQLSDKTCVKLNGLSWAYRTWRGVEDRLGHLTGQVTSIAPYAKGNMMKVLVDGVEIETSRRLPGLCTGYVSKDRIKEEVEKRGKARVAFSRFYDARVNPDSLGLDRCYIVFEKI